MASYDVYIHMYLCVYTHYTYIHIYPTYTHVWFLKVHGLIYSFKCEHTEQCIFRNIWAGIMQMDINQGNWIFSGGVDG